MLYHEPRNVFAVPHLTRIAAIESRVSAIDSLLQPFTVHDVRTDRRLLEARLLRALGAGDTIAPNRTTAVGSLIGELENGPDTARQFQLEPLRRYAIRANERYLRTEVLEALGRDREALAWLTSIGKGSR